MKKNVLNDEELNDINGGIVTRSASIKECIYCGGQMKSKRKGKQTGGAYVCENCGATYDPTLPNPWNPAKTGSADD